MTIEKASLVVIRCHPNPLQTDSMVLATAIRTITLQCLVLGTNLGGRII